MAKAAIYHFTDGSSIRPGVCNNQLRELEEFANSLGYTDTDIYCDRSLKKSEHSEYNSFRSKIDDYDALITKDFYHIHDNTLECMNQLMDIKSHNLSIHSIENGTFEITDDEKIFSEPLKVATYYSRFGNPDNERKIAEIQSEILTLFVDKKTNWKVIDKYIDESSKEIDDSYSSLVDLIKNRSKYDIVLVHNFKDIHRRTSMFCKVRSKLDMDIYSLQEGLFKKQRKEV